MDDDKDSPADQQHHHSVQTFRIADGREESFNGFVNSLPKFLFNIVFGDFYQCIQNDCQSPTQGISSDGDEGSQGASIEDRHRHRGQGGN